MSNSAKVAQVSGYSGQLGRGLIPPVHYTQLKKQTSLTLSHINLPEPGSALSTHLACFFCVSQYRLLLFLFLTDTLRPFPYKEQLFCCFFFKVIFFGGGVGSGVGGWLQVFVVIFPFLS